MIRNYFTSFLRYISRNKSFTLINLFGLVIGMTACMLIIQFILHELSYDDFHVKKDRIFRVQLDRYNQGELSTRWASGAMGVGPDMKANLPEIEKFVRLRKNDAVLTTVDSYYKEDDLYFASADFFQIFSVKLISGIDSLVLKDPFKIVLSQSMAKKYFGDEDPVGKIMKANGGTDYQVSGVFEDLPANTHMKFNALMSFITLQKFQNDPMLSWEWDGFMTYVLLNENADVKDLEAKMPALTKEKAGAFLEPNNEDMKFNFQPVADIHLDSNFMMEFKPNGDRQSTYFLSIVAVLILVIAWINYVILSIAKSIERAREVGVRKLIGGFQSQIRQQFLFESIVLNIIAILISIVFAVLLTPFFGELAGRELGYFLFKQNSFWIWVGILIFGGALLSGIYPAFVLSSYRPVEVLKGKFKSRASGVLFLKSLVVIQFISSVTLIVGTFTVYKQINFMQDQDLGVNIDQTLVIHSPRILDRTYRQKFQTFRQKIEQYSEVISASTGTEIPGQQPSWNAGGIRTLSQTEEESQQYRVIMMDHNYIDAYGLEVIEGRGFSETVVTERRNVMLNESAVRLMGFEKPEDAINNQIDFWGDTCRIVGILKNYHQESPKKAFEPTIFRYNAASRGFFSIKLNTSSIKESISSFEKEWDELFLGNPFVYFFLDDHYNEQYKTDRQFGKVFSLFSSLSIFIACLGLFGLSSLTAVQRTKEIGVRKALGASTNGIMVAVGREYILLMVVAIVLSVPIAWWIMEDWLTSFALRISLNWLLFAIPSLAVATIAVLAVSFHTIKAARTNPVKSLRHE